MTTAVLAPPVTIRAATVDDVPAVVRMGLRFRQDTVYRSRVAENQTQMTALAHRLVDDEAGLLLVVDRNGAVVGMIGAMAFPHHISGQPTVGELFFWVEPEHRGCGVRLLKRAEQWARDRGATSMQMIAPTPDVERLYQRLGYTALEVTYEKPLQQESS